jgi:hypothetical protein
MEVDSKGQGADMLVRDWILKALRRRCRRRTWPGVGVSLGSIRQGADAGATWRVPVMMRYVVCHVCHIGVFVGVFVLRKGTAWGDGF